MKTQAIHFYFDQKRTLQSIYAISKFSKDPVTLSRILEILYLSDRTSLIETGQIITGCSVWNVNDIARILAAEKVVLNFTTFIDGQMYNPGDGELSDYDFSLFERCSLITNPDYPECTRYDRLSGVIPYECILKAHGVSDEIVEEYVLHNIHSNSIKKDFKNEN